MKSLKQKVEDWLANALSDIAPADNIALEKATTSEETSFTRRIIVDCISTGFAEGSLPDFGDRTANAQILLVTSYDEVAAADHDSLEEEIASVLNDPSALLTAANLVDDFLLQYSPTYDSTTGTGEQENGARVRQGSFTLSVILCRNDNGDGT